MKNKLRLLVLLVMVAFVTKLNAQSRIDSVFCNTELIKFSKAIDVAYYKNYPNNLKIFILYEDGVQLNILQKKEEDDDEVNHLLIFNVLIPSEVVEANFFDRNKILNYLLKLFSKNEYTLDSFVKGAIGNSLKGKNLKKENNTIEMITSNGDFDDEMVISVVENENTNYLIKVIYSLTLQ